MGRALSLAEAWNVGDDINMQTCNWPSRMPSLNASFGCIYATVQGQVVPLWQRQMQ